ncbi:EAL domain-containing protein [Paraburkholderia sp. GAS199]|uniref:EAL domain-containing protein n=1 Tax=Paraburkholderia sp. GAS199 TaxID=3035126 RepID=UPI003D25556D
MPDNVKDANQASSKLFDRSPAWRAVRTRLPRLLAAGTGCLIVLTFTLFGERCAHRAVVNHERMAGNDLLMSVERILNSVTLTRQPELATLPGKPCNDARQPLTRLQTYIRYVRGINLVEDGRVYCATGLGQIDIPLSTYVIAGGSGVSVNLLPQTPFHPKDPVVALFVPTARDSGILYLIAGDYIADVLSHGAGYGLEDVVLSIDNSGTLDGNNVFAPATRPAISGSTRMHSARWPLSISLSTNNRFPSRLHWHYRLYFATAGAILDLAIFALYPLGFGRTRRLLREVRRGLRHREFHLVYQPIVDVVSRRTVGVEALLRWEHPKKGPVAPSSFMGEVESSLLLADVTEFVLRTAIVEISNRAPTLPLRVSVNIAAGDLTRKGFAAKVLSLLTMLPVGVGLILELTERFLVNEDPHTLDVFNELKAAGVRFAIDDFGTHHNNLDLISRFPFDYVKVDSQFVRNLDSGGKEIIEAIVSVAERFGSATIAEGVETEAQHRLLQESGVSFCQGYLYQRPVRAERLTRSPEYLPALATETRGD